MAKTKRHRKRKAKPPKQEQEPVVEMTVAEALDDVCTRADVVGVTILVDANGESTWHPFFPKGSGLHFDTIRTQIVGTWKTSDEVCVRRVLSLLHMIANRAAEIAETYSEIADEISATTGVTFEGTIEEVPEAPEVPPSKLN